MLDETYQAARGGGAYRNRERIHASKISSIGESVFCPGGLHLAKAAPHLPKLAELAQRSWAVRMFGGALDACMVAAGQAELWFEPKVEVWDLAALRLIIEEAGGVFFAMDGSRRIDRGAAIGCAPGLADEARRVFAATE
jgi:fructose-1,6-bisphosphatase/inositol monophosphatase family enzyme